MYDQHWTTTILSDKSSARFQMLRSLLDLEPTDDPKENNKYMTGKIPRRIIQTDKTTDLPILARAATMNLRLLNPDFEYLFFDDAQVEEFIDAEFPQYRPVVNSFPVRIQRYDLFRYLAVYHFGGFYFDTDVLLASPLEDLLGCGCVFSFERLGINRFLSTTYGMDWEVGNYAFGASAGHPFLEAIIENCVRAQQHPEWTNTMLKSIPRMFRGEEFVLVTTGPGLVSRTLAEYPGSREEVKVLFPDDIFDRNNWHCFGSFGIHLQVGTWRKRQGLVHRVLRREWEAWVRKSLLNESMKRGRTRTLASLTGPRLLREAGHTIFEEDRRARATLDPRNAV